MSKNQLPFTSDDEFTQATIQEMQGMSKSQKLEVLSVARYFDWLAHGGRKTAEVSRGEQLYNERKGREEVKSFSVLTFALTLAV